MYFDALKFKIIRHLLKKAIRYNSATRRIWLIYLARIMASHTFPVCATRYGGDTKIKGSDLSGPSVTITYSVCGAVTKFGIFKFLAVGVRADRLKPV